MIILESKTVAETVTENIKTADVFKKYGIDFCCGGGISIEKVCANKKIDVSFLLKDLEAVDSTVSRAYNYDAWELDFLIDHIINVHHSYVLESMPILLEYVAKVAKVHGHHYTEVIKINELVLEVAKELIVHLEKEEVILFPFVKQLTQAKKEGNQAPKPHFGTVGNPIQMMEQEHENAGDIFKEIATLSNNYTPPKEACNTFRALYAKLDEFEQDLHQHIHLENNILFPKAIKLEQNF